MQMPSPRPSRLRRKIIEVASAVFVTALAGILFGYMNRPVSQAALPPAVQSRETPVDEYGVRFVRTEPAQPAAEARKDPEPTVVTAAPKATRQAQPAPAVPPRRVATAPDKPRATEPLPLAPAAAPMPPPVVAAPPQESTGSNVLAAFRRIPGWFMPGSGSERAPAAASPEPIPAELPPRPPRPIGQFVQGTM